MIEKFDWDWADIDGPDLVYDHPGKPWRRRTHNDRDRPASVLIADLNGTEFERRMAPY
ncbi:MAG: hypothetical protein AAF415_14840 [Pseudomonadota bacterium]